jgi:hypothetical protein
MATRPSRPGFRPHFTLFLLYFALFFLGFALLLILPEMLEALERLPPDADPEREGAELARRIAAPRLLAAFLLAAVTLGLGAWFQVLPGLKSSP